MNNQIPQNLPTGLPAQNSIHSNGQSGANAKPETKKNTAPRFWGFFDHFQDVFSIIGVIAFIIIIIFAASYTAKYASVGIKNVMSAVTLSTTSLFSSEEVIPEISTEEVIVGKPFTLSWSHLNRAQNGSYSISYPCADGLYLTAKTVSNGKETVLCNKDFDFINQNNELVLIPTSSKYHSAVLPITLKFTRNGENNPSLSGLIQVEIINPNIKEGAVATDSGAETITAEIKPIATAPTVTVPSTPIYGQTVTNIYNLGGTNVPVVENPNGLPDLRVTILDVGYLDANSNFISDSAPQRSTRNAVKFKIENIGDKTSGRYRFNAYLPTFPAQTYNSDEQVGIIPGSGVQYTIGFDKALSGNQVFRVLVDGGNYVNESNENNNDVSITINFR